MKTLKELQDRGTNYLCGYTDALAEFASMLIKPALYDREHTGVLLTYLTEYLDILLKEGAGNVTK